MYNYVLYTCVPCLVWSWCRTVGQSRLNAELLLRSIRENQLWYTITLFRSCQRITISFDNWILITLSWFNGDPSTCRATLIRQLQNIIANDQILNYNVPTNASLKAFRRATTNVTWLTILLPFIPCNLLLKKKLIDIRVNTLRHIQRCCKAVNSFQIICEQISETYLIFSDISVS